MRVLWVSNGRRIPSGYGNQTHLFTPRIKNAGYELAIFAFCGQEGSPSVDADGIVTYPRFYDAFGNDAVEMHAAHHKADVVFSLVDPHALKADVYRNFQWASWTPVDSTPALPILTDALNKGRCRWVVSMSKHGHEQLQNAGFKPIYIPHGVDTQSTFFPIDRTEARARLAKHLHENLEGKFIVAMNGANRAPSRKGFAYAMNAFKVFSDKFTESRLLLHTDILGHESGENLMLMAKTIGIPLERIMFPNQYAYQCGMLNGNYLNDMYNAADVFLHTAHGEGFGIPLVEAQSSGCPVIASDFSAMSELNFGGWKIGGTPFYYNMIQWLNPSVDATIAALEEAHSQADERRDLARQGALAYDVEAVMQKYMLPFLQRVENELAEDEARLQPRRKRQPIKTRPDVSVLIPVYNVGRYGVAEFEARIQKTLEQHCQMQVVICDDGSDDNGETESILQKLHWQDKRIQITAHARNLGGSEATNTAATIAQGRYFIIGSARSWYEPNSLQDLVRVLDEQPERGFAYGFTQYHGAWEHRDEPPDYKREDFFTDFPSRFGYLYRREAWDRGCKYTPYLKVKGQTICIGDYDFIMQMICNLGWSGVRVPRLVLNYHRDKDGQVSHLVDEYRPQIDEIFRTRWQAKMKVAEPL